MKQLLTPQLFSGSITGANHRAINKNNQDSYFAASGPGWSVGVVCDGCGSQPFSEFGARLGASVIGNSIAGSMAMARLFLLDNPHVKGIDYKTNTIADAQNALVNAMSFLLDRSRERKQYVEEHLLFTVIGWFSICGEIYFFGCGDGYYGWNGQHFQIGPFHENSPPYIGYRLLESTPAGQRNYALTFHGGVPLEDVMSVFVGSDGLEDLLAAEGKMKPNGRETVPSLGTLMDAKFLSNPHKIQRQLNLVNGESVRANPAGHTHHYKGLLPDDTTIVVGLFGPQEEEQNPLAATEIREEGGVKIGSNSQRQEITV